MLFARFSIHSVSSLDCPPNHWYIGAEVSSALLFRVAMEGDGTSRIDLSGAWQMRTNQAKKNVYRLIDRSFIFAFNCRFANSSGETSIWSVEDHCRRSLNEEKRTSTSFQASLLPSSLLSFLFPLNLCPPDSFLPLDSLWHLLLQSYRPSLQ